MRAGIGPIATAAVDRVKLAKVLALTGSPVDGEALAAARMAMQIVLRSGLDWLQILTPPPGVPPREIELEVDFADPTVLLAICVQNSHALAGWEVGFVEAAARQRAPLGRVQNALLTHLARKAFAAAEARRGPAAPAHAPRKRTRHKSGRRRAA